MEKPISGPTGPKGREPCEFNPTGPTGPKRRGPCKFTQRDVQRVMRAAKNVGMSARIEIAPDGRISIIPFIEMAPALVAGVTGPNEWDTVL
jgi:hypothetical protein